MKKLTLITLLSAISIFLHAGQWRTMQNNCTVKYYDYDKQKYEEKELLIKGETYWFDYLKDSHSVAYDYKKGKFYISDIKKESPLEGFIVDEMSYVKALKHSEEVK